MFDSKLINLPDFAKIGVMAFAFIWLMNKGLDTAGLLQYKA